MYYVEYNNEPDKRSKAWEISDKTNDIEQEFVTTKICYRPILSNGVYSSHDFGVGNKNGFFIELLSPNWHLQKPFYWRLEPDLGSGYERIVLYLDREVEVITAAGFTSYEELVSQDVINCYSEVKTLSTGERISNTKLAELKAMIYFERQEALKPLFSEANRFSGEIRTSASGPDFYTSGLTFDGEIIQVNIKIHIVRVQTLRRIPVGGGAGIGQTIKESEKLFERPFDSDSKIGAIAHYFGNGGVQIIFYGDELYRRSRSPINNNRDFPLTVINNNRVWIRKNICKIELTPPDRFRKASYLIENNLMSNSNRGLNIFMSSEYSFDLQLDKSILSSSEGIAGWFGIHASSIGLWSDFELYFGSIKSRKWEDANYVPRETNSIEDWMRQGATSPWSWESSKIDYKPISLGIQLSTDLFIGLIPVIGDILDITEFIQAIFTGRDRWGERVSGSDYVFLALSLLPLLSGLHRRVGNRTRDLNENLVRLNTIPRDVFDNLVRSNVNSSQSRRLIQQLFDKIFNEMPSSRSLREEYLKNYLATGFWKNSQIELTEELFEVLQIFTATERHQIISLAGLRSDQLVREIFG